MYPFFSHNSPHQGYSSVESSSFLSNPYSAPVRPPPLSSPSYFSSDYLSLSNMPSMYNPNLYTSTAPSLTLSSSSVSLPSTLSSSSVSLPSTPAEEHYVVNSPHQGYSSVESSSFLSNPYSAPVRPPPLSSPSYSSDYLSLSNIPSMYNPNLYASTAPSLTLSSSSVSLPSTPAQEHVVSDEPSPTAPLPPVTFKGRRQVSQSGKRSVLSYRIPETSTGYTFAHVRTNKSYDVYACTGCKKQRWNPIQVIGDEFLTDPCELGHVCTPTELGKDIANRIVYKELHRMRDDPTRYDGQTPLMVWNRLLTTTESGDMDQDVGIDTDDLRDSVLTDIHQRDFATRRQTISDRLNEIGGNQVSLTNVPPSLAQFRNGSLFLHEGPSEDIHIYYSEKTIELACRNGLFALVGDGVHTYQPKKMEQLYTVHAVCEGGIEMPVLHAITAKKTTRVYEKIFSHLRTQFQRHGIPESRLRIILDFEKAAIKAARKVFPRATVEGCIFHLGQAWTRRRNALQLTLYTQAYSRCREFLDYLRDTWLTGTFKDLWCKFGIYTLRTTNTAESYHRKLQELFKCAHPPLATLVKTLREIDLHARCKLMYKERHPNEGKRLRARDRRRRERVERCMRRFNGRYQTRGATNAEVETYCKRMSRFIACKAI
ncbi:hypothetical protein Y032_0017g3270 [Ancylostoma ceylanicum]|uniref:MULE transposase domain-containing protein n=1 Tax=Ancylostoma ceylanicum TaxID=53326 RepID=A0A016V3P1_9BILA|nr:hypothetical protein Y032_0017g3270 [Ancylostoma ceylanicum]